MNPLLRPLALLALLCVSTAQETPRPNVVILLADDLGWGDLGCYGGSIPTPNVDRIAAEGARFTQAYAPSPLCTPSRAGLFTGRFPAELGVHAEVGANKVARRRNKGLPAEVVVLPERLAPLGYVTGLVGKWHLGLKGMDPTTQGFDEFFGFLGGSHVYMPGGPDTKMLRNEVLEEEKEAEYLTDAFAREAEAFVARHAAEPFVLTVAFNAPHVPLEAMEDDLARFPDLAGPAQTYAAMVASLDDAVGRVLAALERAGLAERTLVVFASDNGAPLAESPGSNGPFALGKGHLFEGGLRVPLCVRWPGRVAPGTEIDAPVSLLDVTATTLALAGADEGVLGELDGIDLAPLLAGAEPPEGRTFLWKVGPSEALRKGDWKLIRSKASRWLFDLAADPGEKQDLVAERADVADALAKALDEWVATLPEQLWENQALDTPAMMQGKAYWVEF